MQTKPNLLIVGDYSRTDFINLFQSCFNDFNFYFLHFSSDKEISKSHLHNCQLVGTPIYWGDYKHVDELLSFINPHKVVFFFIESYHQVLLNIFCKLRGIHTYHLDHGIRDNDINLRLEKAVLAQKELLQAYPFHLKLEQFSSRLKARLFLLRSKKLLPSTEATYFNSYIKIRKNNNWLETFKKTISPFRLAEAYIVFNDKALNVYQHYDQYPKSTKIHKIGIPIFDSYYNMKKSDGLSKKIVLIDQGLSERGLYGWTDSYYKNFLSQLLTITQLHGYQLLIKPHPKQVDLTIIKKLGVSIVSDDEMKELMTKTKAVIAFTSTLLLPLIAQKHLTIFTLENHPAGNYMISRPFVEAGVAKPIHSLDELKECFTKIEEIHRQQLPYKAKFTEEWMYKFDGKAGERLRDILLSDEL